MSERQKIANAIEACDWSIASTRIKNLVKSAVKHLRDSPSWQPVPKDTVIKEATNGKHILAYENGRYFNAWLDFEPSDGFWVWRDDADSEPNPSHWMPLPDEPLSTPTSRP